MSFSLFVVPVVGLDKLMNATLLDMSAGARTDSDPMVVVTTLENLEKMLKAMNGRSLILEEKVVESLLVTIDDIFNNKVHGKERVKRGRKEKGQWKEGSGERKRRERNIDFILDPAHLGSMPRRGGA